MELRSKAFEEGEAIPKKYGYKQDNCNPPLEVVAVPEDAVSLALIMDDPDVPPSVRADCMWVHWLLYDLDPTETILKEDCGGIATLGRNSGGELAYMGPCPPDREHRYFFKLYALDRKLALGAGATKEQLLEAMEGHVIAQAALMGRFKPTV